MKTKKQYDTVYRMKLTDFNFCVLIGALMNRRSKMKDAGEDTAGINHLLLKVFESYES